MKKGYPFFYLLFILAIATGSVNAQTVVFSDNFDRASFTTGSTGGTPATLYKFTLGGAFTINTTLVSGSNYRVDNDPALQVRKGLCFMHLCQPIRPHSAGNCR